jgi:hypothetical protein
MNDVAVSPHVDGAEPAPPTGAAGPAGSDAARRLKRPIPVTILAIFQLAQAVLYFGGVVLIALNPEGVLVEVETVTLGAALAGVAGIQAISAFGLLRQQQFGWTLAMLTAGVSLAGQIATWWTQGTLIPLSMLLAVVTVLYLNQVPVRATFGLATRHEVDELVGERG